jgi:hypothetical protein
MDDPLYRHAGAGTGGADDGGNLVFVNEFFGDVNRFGRITLGIADDEFDGPSIDTAFFVDFVDRHGGHEFGGRADKGCRAGQVKKGADFDGVFRRSIASPQNQHESRNGGRYNIYQFHCFLLLRFGGLVALM